MPRLEFGLTVFQRLDDVSYFGNTDVLTFCFGIDCQQYDALGGADVIQDTIPATFATL